MDFRTGGGQPPPFPFPVLPRDAAAKASRAIHSSLRVINPCETNDWTLRKRGSMIEISRKIEEPSLGVPVESLGRADSPSSW